MKTVKQEEPIARSRFADCPVCKNHTLKVKKTIQVGRCKSCNETYKILVVYVKTTRKNKPASLSSEPLSEAKHESKPEAAPPPVPASSQQPSDTVLLPSPPPDYSGLAEAIFGEGHRQPSTESSQSSGQ